MLDPTIPIVAGWQNFYLIIGPSAAALMGLQFVVVALAKETPLPTSPLGVDSFSTPTIVHFAAVLMIAALLTAPWHSLHGPAVSLTAGAVLGVLYVFVVAGRIKRMKIYDAILEDWIWHTILPLAAYVMLGVAALSLYVHAPTALFVIAAASMLLLLTGIHNAWDIATYLTLQTRESAERARSITSATSTLPE